MTNDIDRIDAPVIPATPAMPAQTATAVSVTASTGIFRWIFAVGMVIIAFVLQTLARVHPEFIEAYYSRIIYPQIGRTLTYLNSHFSFSLAEALLFAGVAVLIGGAGWQIRCLVRKQLSWRRMFVHNLLNLVGIAGAGLVLFLVLWGLNYERKPLADNLQLPRRAANADELELVCRAIIDEVNRSYQEVRSNGYLRQTSTNAIAAETKSPLDWRQLDNVLEDSFQRERLLGVAAAGGFGPPKPVYLSRWMSKFGISGIYIPFTGEPNFNAEQPDCELPFTIAHEKSHQRGFALEDEANFVAFLICIKSSHPYSRYSGYLMAASHVLTTFYRVAPDRYYQILATLGDGPRADFRAMHDFWTNNEGRLSQLSETVNNTYLKANNVGSGVENYSEVVELIIGYYYTNPNKSGPDNAPAPIDISEK